MTLLLGRMAHRPISRSLPPIAIGHFQHIRTGNKETGATCKSRARPVICPASLGQDRPSRAMATRFHNRGGLAGQDEGGGQGRKGAREGAGGSALLGAVLPLQVQQQPLSVQPAAVSGEGPPAPMTR